jgi:hypothetical protein
MLYVILVMHREYSSPLSRLQRSTSTTSPPSRVRVPRHVARLVTQLVAPLVIDYSALRRLVVVDYFASAAHPGASARRAARHAARRAARSRLHRLAQASRRLLRLRHASGCLGTLRGSSRGSSPLVVDYSASRRLVVVDYFASTAHPGASAHCATRHAARRAARRRLLRLRRASGCLGTSRRSSSTTPPRVGSLSTTSSSPRVRVPRHVARLVTQLVVSLVVDYFASHRLVVDYFVFAARPGASARRAARHAARRAARR